MKTKDIIKIIEKVAPLETQEEWDNSGMQICAHDREIKRILVALDITNDVIDEALENKIDLIVTHHPLIFYPLSLVDMKQRVDKCVIRLAESDINVLSFHTPFDKAKGGINDYFLGQLGVKNIQIYNDLVRVGSLSKAITLKELAEKIAKVSGQKGFVKVQGDPKAKVKNIGMCSGSAGEMFDIAKEAGADVYISGDIKHNEGLDAKDTGIYLIDAGHYGTENCFIEIMYKLLSSKCGTKVKVYKTKTVQNPFDYTV